MPHIVFAFTGDVRRNSRAIKQLRALVELGYAVTVLCFGKTEKVDGISFQSIPNPKGRGARYFWKVHQYFLQALKNLPADAYHASDIYVLKAMATVAKRHQAKLVFDSRELYPHVASTVGRPWVSLFWHWISARYFPKCDALFTVCPSIAEVLTQTYDVPKPTVLYNVPPRQEVEKTDILRETFRVVFSDCIFLHQGNMQRDRGLTQLLQAFKNVENAVLIFMGGGALKDELLNRVEQLEMKDKVFFLPPVPPEEMLRYTASADVGITLVEDTCLNHRYALPNKLFEYAFAGLPILASNLHETQRLLDGFPIGIKVNPQNVAELQAALIKLAENPALRQHFRDNTVYFANAFTPEQFSQDFKRIYQSIIAPP